VAITTAFVPLLLMAPIVPVTAQAAESKQAVGHGTGGDIFCSSEPRGSGIFGTGISSAIIDFSASSSTRK
jgi:hypothetical protein